MGKETLSVKQANSIINSMNDIARDCCVETERANDEFVDELSRIWEDQNAVDFAKLHKQNVTDMINNLNSNNETYVRTVTDIANSYIKAGGVNEKVNALVAKRVANINVDRVKEYFTNTENADDFGFINPETGVDAIASVYENYEKKIERISLDTSKKIQQINAFGNQDVQLALASSAGKVVDIFLKGVKTETNHLREAVDKTAKNYIAVGRAVSGIESNQLLYGPAPGGGSGGSGGSGEDKPNQLLYGPAPGPSGGVSGGGVSGEYKPNQALYGPAPGPSGGSSGGSGSGEYKPNQVLYGPAPGPSGGVSGGSASGEYKPNQVLYGPAPGPSGTGVGKIEGGGHGEFKPNQYVYGPAPRGEIHINKSDSSN